MSDRVVPGWARWCLVLGVLLPMASYFMLGGYSRALGFWGNLMQQDVVVGFMRGQNPVSCLSEFIRNTAGSPLGYEINRSFECTKPTLIPYRHILLISVLMFGFGLWRHINPEQIANKWPTEWRVFDPRNAATKKPAEKPAEKYDPSAEGAIKPDEGGF